MLSLKKINENSIPICQISGGKYDEKIVYFNEGGDEKNNEIEYNMKLNSLINEMIEDNQYFGDLKGSAKKKAKLLMREHVMKNIPPLDDSFRDKYNRVKEDINKKGNKQIEIVDGEMLPYCNKNKRSIYYICAPSGAGKSYFMNQFAKSYKKQHPKNEVILFSKLDKDKTLDDNEDIKRMEVDEAIISDPIQPEELKNSLVLFDDTMMIRDKKINKELNENLMKDLLETGRHPNIDMCISNHLINDYTKTRPLMNEATHLVFFTRGGNRYSITYCLKQYLGFDRHQIQKIFKIPSTRWVMICKQTFPMCIVHQHGCYILDGKDDNEDKNEKIIKKIKKSVKFDSEEEEDDDEYDEYSD